MLKIKGFSVLWEEKTTSTSEWIRTSLATLGGNTVFIVDEQSSGRGQGDHKWHSAPGKNLTFSILIKYDNSHEIRAVHQQVLTMACSLAVVDFLAENGISAIIKRPNDIYVGQKKICGMLIENGLKGERMEWSIIGMGIDVNETAFPDDLPNPVSMSQITGQEYDLKKCLGSFLRHFSLRFDAIWNSRDKLEKEYSSIALL